MAAQSAEKNVQRSNEAMLGGVCAGLAERFDLDPIVVRILFIYIALLTLGVGVLAYIVLWMRLPLGAEPDIPYEITPEHAESKSFGSIDRFTGRAKSRMSSRPESGVPLLARLAVAASLMLLFIAAAVIVSPLMPGTEWWQFWPLALVIAGLTLIVIPIPSRFGAAWHALGIVTVSAAATMVPMSLDIFAWESFVYAFSQTWPLFVAAGALFAVGMHRQNDVVIVASSFLVVAFCILALTMFALPGDAQSLLVGTSEGRSIGILFIGR